MRIKRKFLVEKDARKKILDFAGEQGIDIVTVEQVFMCSIVLTEKHDYLVPNYSHFMWYALGKNENGNEFHVTMELKQGNLFAIPNERVESIEDYDSEFLADDHIYKKYYDYAEDCDVYLPAV